MNQSGEQLPNETSHFEKVQPVDVSLTYEQYLIIQHFLPKRYALLEPKNVKKGLTSSAVKLSMDQMQNISKGSGNVENTQEIQGRTKRVRTKKIDKYLEEEVPKLPKRTITEISTSEDEMSQCLNILTLLKKHKNSYPFLVPVDPKRDGVLNYFDVIKDPMDLSTIEANLSIGAYQNAAQFHAQVNKIWQNSYAFNDKSTTIYKLTADMDKYYKGLISNQNKKTIKTDKSKSKAETKDKESKSQGKKEVNDIISQDLERKKSQFFVPKEEKQIMEPFDENMSEE